MIKIAIVEDEVMIANMLKEKLENSTEFGINVVHCVYKGEDAVNLLDSNDLDIDLMLLDIELPNPDGFAILRRIKSLNKDIKVLILTSQNYPALHNEIKELGAWGYVPKSADLTVLVEAITKIYGGDKYFNEELLSKAGPTKFITNYEDMVLSNDERLILKFIMMKKKNKELAHLLNKNFYTLKRYKTRLFSKFGVKNSNELIELVKRNKIKY